MLAGVTSAVRNVNEIIAPQLIGLSPTDQKAIDEKMVQELDGSRNEWGWSKSKLGANAILAVSMAVCKAGAGAKKTPLYKHIAQLAGNPTDQMCMPVPAFNIINGGSHAGNKLAMQEFMILPVGATTFSEVRRSSKQGKAPRLRPTRALRGAPNTAGDENGLGGVPQPQRRDQEEVWPGCVQRWRRGRLRAEHPGQHGRSRSRGRGDREGGLHRCRAAIPRHCVPVHDLPFARPFAGLPRGTMFCPTRHAGKVKIGMDVAASEFWKDEKKVYDLDFKTEMNDGTQCKTGEQLGELYASFCRDYPMVSIEDPFDQDDFESCARSPMHARPPQLSLGDARRRYTKMTADLGGACQIVGDDLLVTNPSRVQKAIEQKACNALLLKVNQIGTVTEAMEAVKIAKKAGWGVMTSHRSGETEDSFIVSLLPCARSRLASRASRQPPPNPRPCRRRLTSPWG